MKKVLYIYQVRIGRIDPRLTRVCRWLFRTFLFTGSLILSVNMQKEIWKPVVGFEGLYEVSNLGRVRNRKGKVLRPAPNSNGYMRIILRKDNKDWGKQIHRLVAMAFIPNPNNLPIINHINERTGDNRVENLEWCNYSYNFWVSSKCNAKNRRVIQKDKEGNIIAEYKSISEAARAMGNEQAKSSICKCIRFRMGLRKTKRSCNTCMGYIWEYA